MSDGDAPLLSVCIPTFNRAVFLRQAVESVFHALAPGARQRVEVVVSDNASTDETAQVAKELAATYATFRSTRQPENRGFDANYRSSILLARGRFAMTLGDDDWLEAGGVARILETLDAHPGLTGLTVLANGYSANGDLISSVPTTARGLTEVTGVREIFAYRGLGFLFGNMSLHILRTSLAQRLLDENALLGNGCACHQLYCLAVRETARWALLEEPCVAWRYGNDSFSGSGLHRRLRLALRGYRENLEVVFGNDSPLVADFQRREALHIARRYAIRSKNAPGLNKHYGTYRSSVREQFRVGFEATSELWRQPGFWTQVAPTLLLPSPLFRLAVRMRPSRRRTSPS